MKYRFNGSLVGVPDDWRLDTSLSGTLRSVKVEVTNDTVEFIYRTLVTSRDCKVYSATASVAVDIEIFELEVFLDSFPYTYNYIPTDIFEDSYFKNPNGEWIPEFADASTGGNVAAGGTFQGYYSKAGNHVTITGSCVNVDTTGMATSNDIFIRNLPFSPLSKGGVILNFVGPVSSEIMGWNVAGGALITAELLDGTDYIKIAESQSSAGKDYIQVGQITSGSGDLYFTMSYLTA